MSEYNDYNEGDLVEAVKGERKVVDRLQRQVAPFPTRLHIGRPSLMGLSGLNDYISAGFKITVIEKAPEPLPTEPGTVIAIGDWWLVRLRPYNIHLGAAWEMLPAPEAVDRHMRRNGASAQSVYSDEWVQAEVDQDPNGFRIISKPVAS